MDNVEALIRITVIEAGPRILPALPEHLAAAIAKLLHDLGVHIRSDTRVIEVSDGSVRLADKSFLDAEPVVWSAGIKAPDFLKELDGREIDRINRLVVRESLQTTRDDHVFAIGDCASCVLPGDDKPLPPRAPTARQQAHHLVVAIGKRLKGRPLCRFRYRDFGSLVSLAHYRTFGNVIGGLKIEGPVAKLMYRALYRMHLRSIHGNVRTAFDTLAEFITRRTEPRTKLH